MVSSCRNNGTISQELRYPFTGTVVQFWQESSGIMIKEFSHKTIEALGYYVYVYSDPDTRRPFYVGKGKGNRVFNHMDDQSENEKVRKINDIKARGKEPNIEILAHGLDEETAFKVEAAAIDLIGIENLTNR